MKEIHVWVTDSHTPLVFEDVQLYRETKLGLEITQEEMYLTTTTMIYRQNLLRYTLFEHR
jgi:hypothetical protein